MTDKLPGFERFWEAYRYKLSRKDAVKAWKKHGCEDFADQVIAAIPAYDAHLAANTWKNKKNAATWLNGECWTDEYPTEQPRQTGRRSIVDVARDYIGNSRNDFGFAQSVKH